MIKNKTTYCIIEKQHIGVPYFAWYSVAGLRSFKVTLVSSPLEGRKGSISLPDK